MTTITTIEWHEQIKAAALEVFGDECGAEIEAVDLDDYRGMDPREAIEAIVAAAIESKVEV